MWRLSYRITFQLRFLTFRCGSFRTDLDFFGTLWTFKSIVHDRSTTKSVLVGRAALGFCGLWPWVQSRKNLIVPALASFCGKSQGASAHEPALKEHVKVVMGVETCGLF